ncbi:fungal-specific transcription factor domain-containing protein [Desarmillaria tabescens]|uniref:Fungal-specific transcription factor domain-containing protein n=1 Tax=Armillaria tabescens TaxID=1929756 RepID=A0AA39TTB3_ARMTA|nr:fungal-specific transcription factor domain-containing protein [Desarmillaria tabescens]KAK0469527.1 fungal-specific transcription factor domain-containing protein [Desarmillaria tabescens]
MKERAPSTTTAKKRRLRGACDLCKQKKIRCDSAKMPGNICSSCIAYNEECTHISSNTKKDVKPRSAYNFVNYASPPFDQLGEGSNVNSFQISAGSSVLKAQINDILTDSYVAPSDPSIAKQLLVDLATSVHALESELAVCRQVLAREVSVPVSVSNISSPIPVTAVADEDATTVVEDKTDVYLTDSLKRLTIGQSRHRHYGKSSALMLMKRAVEIKKEFTGTSEGLSFEAKRPEFWNDQPWQKSLHEDEHQPLLVFPDDDLLQDLIDLYYEECDMIVHLIYRPKFEKNVAQGLHLYDRRFGSVVLLVCAIAAPYSNDPRVFLDPAQEHSAGWQWYQQVRPIPSSFVAPSSIYDLQIYSLMVLYANTSTTPELSWVLPGLGIRMAQSVAAHRRKPDKSEWTVEDEEWKRAFWAIFCVDVFSCVTTGRPLATTSDDYDLDMPIECDDEYWEHPNPSRAFKQPAGKLSTVTFWVKYLELLEIFAFMHRTIYAVKRSAISKEMRGPEWDSRVVVTIDSALNKWVDSVPDHLRWNPHNPDPRFFKQSTLLYSVYYWVQIQVHRPFISTVSQPSPISFPSLAICANAARSCCHVLDTYQQRGFRPLTVAEISLFYSAIILLINVWRGRKYGSSASLDRDIDDIRKCINILQVHEKRWQIAGRYNDMLRGLLADLDSIPVTHVPSLKRTREGEEVSSTPLTLSPLPVLEWAHPSTESLPPDPEIDAINSQQLFNLPLYTDELGRPSLATDYLGKGVDGNDYAEWFQQHFPGDTFLSTGYSNEMSWSAADHPGRLSGGFLSSFMGEYNAHFEIPQQQAGNSPASIDQEMAKWFSQN